MANVAIQLCKKIIQIGPVNTIIEFNFYFKCGLVLIVAFYVVVFDNEM